MTAGSRSTFIVGLKVNGTQVETIWSVDISKFNLKRILTNVKHT